MIILTTHRPRNVNTARAASILYGDLGTSKAYALGLAVSLAGYASFWLVLGVALLSLCVGTCYTVICRLYPRGGGVYASVRNRWPFLAFIGAFFIFSDLLITSSLSALSAFHYLGVSNPVIYSAMAVVIIGVLNYFGPKHTGTIALFLAISVFIIFTIISGMTLPFLKTGINNIQHLHGSPLSIWTQFCVIIVALSGVETIANVTPVMKLNPGTTLEKPNVSKTSTPAIYIVIAEVVIYTLIFAIAVLGTETLTIENRTISVPGHPNIEDKLISYLAFFFSTKMFGITVGLVFSKIAGFIIGCTLLSAVNSAIIGLTSLQYLMGADEELPYVFCKMNKFGVPVIPLIISFGIPALLILAFKKVILLADLYAIGFVGAIATNLGCTSTDSRLNLSKKERYFMFFSFLIMATIEITLFIMKPSARYFVLSVMFSGLLLKLLSMYLKKRAPISIKIPIPTLSQAVMQAPLCIITKPGKALITVIDISNETKTPVNIVFVKEQKVLSEDDLHETVYKNPKAKQVLDYIKEYADLNLVHFKYTVSDSFEDIAAAYAFEWEAKKLFIDVPVMKKYDIIRNRYINNVKKLLPDYTKLTAI